MSNKSNNKDKKQTDSLKIKKIENEDPKAITKAAADLTPDLPSNLDDLTFQVINRNEKIKVEMWQIGRILHKINTDKLYEQWKYKSFMEYCENELSYTRRTAYNFIKLYENYEFKYVKDSPYDNYKLLLLVRYINNKEDREKYINKLPPKISYRQLENKLQRDLGINPYKEKDNEDIIIESLKPNYRHIKNLLHDIVPKKKLTEIKEKSLMHDLEKETKEYFEHVKKILRKYDI